MTQASFVATRADASFALSNRAVAIFVSAVMLLPSALFAITLRPAPAALVIAGCIGALVLIAQKASPEESGPLDAPVDVKRLALSAALAGAVFILGGALHLFHPPSDWHIRDAVLADLSGGEFPPVYQVNSLDYILRAPLGMYMVPAIAGRMFGLLAAHIILWLQNSVLLGAILYLLGTLGRGWRHVLIILLFGSAVPSVMAIFLAATGLELPQFEKASGHALEAWRFYVRPSGSVHQYFWAPNHALPAWWLATLMLLKTRAQSHAASLTVSIAAASFWSPLAVLPAAFWLVFVAITDWRRHLACARFWAAALVGLCFLPIAIYMVVGASTISHGVNAAYPDMLRNPAVIFVVFSHAVYVFAHRSFLPPQLFILFAFNFLVLLALPLLHFGPTDDLVTRGLITPMVIIAFAFGWILLDAKLERWRFYMGCALVIAGAATVLPELVQTMGRAPYAISDCALIDASRATGDEGLPTNYIVESAKMPTWLMGPEAKSKTRPAERRCWSDG
jgi:hypothetical protein